MQSVYPLKDPYKIMEDISLNDTVKYFNYVNKLSDGIIIRIIRPESIFVKDLKTNYEEKIFKANIILNVTLFETQVMDKLSEKYQFINNIKYLESVSGNINAVIDIIDCIKNDTTAIKDHINDETNKLKIEILRLNKDIEKITRSSFHDSIFMLIMLIFIIYNNANLISNIHKFIIYIYELGYNNLLLNSEIKNLF